ncbi:carboxymuconolactone decarboxylase family protein [Sinomicrobium weinanense]|uniref:Carboxymuconolactone decarboxylase family protein n=1 Tax=Sinomicrobium weinanense TaxID=2842200 RepID=A0A926JS96_9FLAO|nr:carboxymuconolactone decarboxylase family protein [Sinomicrobium weinanense]MBC9796456.1 carboxymuconolactone decarboxylase family protein [Sinomicrobium weinanense]MBU3125947.1 carboxymuconolactone decarboxylase family protein [Sinomicrobium weinanense]
MDYKEISKRTIGHLYQAHNSIRNSGIAPQYIVLAELRVSQLNGCAYCCRFHTGELREIGMTPEFIDSIPGFRHSSAFSNKQRLVLEFAEAVSGLEGNIPAIREALSACFTEKEITELTASIALMGALNRLRIVLGAPDEF